MIVRVITLNVNRDIVIVGDLHLVDLEPRTKISRSYKDPRFSIDDAFSSALQSIQTNAKGPLTLVINGDFIDFDLIVLGAEVNESTAKKKLDRVLVDHRTLFQAILRFLAGVETTSGGPALPMRATNLHKFIPYWSLVGKQLVRKASHALLGRSLLRQLRDEFATYPLTRWRQDTLDCLEQDDILDHAHMHSGGLYNAERLANFLKQARTEEFSQETFLSRILTVEMALRSVGASF